MTAPVKRYNMHECDDDRYLPALPVVLASDYDRLEQECAELRKKLNSATGQAARRNIYISIAESLLSDPDYELSGTDFDYEHPLHDKIKAIKTERDTLRGQVEAMRVLLTRASSSYGALLSDCGLKHTALLAEIDADLQAKP